MKSDADDMSDRAPDRDPNAPDAAQAQPPDHGPRVSFVWKFVAIAVAIWATSATLLLITAGGGNTGPRTVSTLAPGPAAASFFNALHAEQEMRTIGVTDSRDDP